jgi:cysteine synthase A
MLTRGFATNAVGVDGFTGAVGNTPLVSLTSVSDSSWIMTFIRYI